MDLLNLDTEQELIQKAILDFYTEGHVKNNCEYYKNILHPGWRFFYFSKGNLRIVDRDEYFSWYNPKDYDPSLQWETEFYYIDITENLASVKLRLEYQKEKYIDYFNMMKIDGKWWIVHKMSHPVRKGD